MSEEIIKAEEAEVVEAPVESVNSDEAALNKVVAEGEVVAEKADAQTDSEVVADEAIAEEEVVA